MIKTEPYKILEDGTVLIRTYSDTGHYIVQDETGIEYSEAVDPEATGRTYTESERSLEEGSPTSSEELETEVQA